MGAAMRSSKETGALDWMFGDFARACDDDVRIKTFAPPQPLVFNVPKSYSQTVFRNEHHKYRAPLPVLLRVLSFDWSKLRWKKFYLCTKEHTAELPPGPDRELCCQQHPELCSTPSLRSAHSEAR